MDKIKAALLRQPPNFQVFKCYGLLWLESLLSDSFVLLSFFTAVPDLFVLIFLLLELVTTLVFDWLDALFVRAFWPEDGFGTALFVTVVVDLRVVTVLLSVEGFVADLFVTVVGDLLVVTALLPEWGFETDLLVSVAVGLRVVAVLFPFEGFVTGLLVIVVFDLREVFTEETAVDFLYWSGYVLANLASPSFLSSGWEYVAL